MSVLLLAAIFSIGQASAYSVFTHEQLIDLAWKPLIEPLLLSRFPHATAEELKTAHAYAYGGCAIQDMGYYPFGKEFFSNLTHYARTGDFVTALLRDARTVDEYAFAIGAFSHYVGDNIGHHDAVNPSTALAFPKLAKKYDSEIVTYDESPHAHVRVEFGFDIDQLSKRRLAPAAYTEFIGLRVSRRLLEQSFREVYALQLGEVLGPPRPAIRTYRTAVRSLLPRFAHAETVIHRHSFSPDLPNREFEQYIARINSTDFAKLWNPYRRKAGVITYLLAFLIRIVPKVGPISDLAIKIPTQHTGDLYITSVNRSVELFEQTLGSFKNPAHSVPPIPNRDLDTGERTRPGAYALADSTYAELLHRVVADRRRAVPEPLRDDLLAFYADPAAPIHTKKKKKQWRQVQDDLALLRALPADGSVTGP